MSGSTGTKEMGSGGSSSPPGVQWEQIFLVLRIISAGGLGILLIILAGVVLFPLAHQSSQELEQQSLMSVTEGQAVQELTSSLQGFDDSIQRVFRRADGQLIILSRILLNRYPVQVFLGFTPEGSLTRVEFLGGVVPPQIDRILGPRGQLPELLPALAERPVQVLYRRIGILRDTVVSQLREVR